MQKGLIHVYTGDGKGKTTAAVGLALRACGAGKRVFIVSFLKTMQSAEADFINDANCDNLKVFRFEHEHGFVKDSSCEKIREDTQKALDFIADALKNERCDMLILDEIICSHNLGYVTKKQLKDIIAIKPDMCELVLTGRGAPEWIIDAADYVTEMKPLKHPYTKGIDARSGVEF